jgi:hypothetical protein
MTGTLPVDDLFEKAEVQRIEELTLFENDEGVLFALSESLDNDDEVVKIDVVEKTVEVRDQKEFSPDQISILRDQATEQGAVTD